MLVLTLNGNIIPIPLDFSMRLTWKNPACDFEKIPSGYGLGLSFPINEHTRALFGNPERFAKYRTANDQKFPGFEVRFSGVLLMSGSLSITTASGGNYEATIIDEIGVLGENEQERDILEFPEFNKLVNWTNSANYSPDTHPYCCFPIINAGFFKEKGLIKKIPVWETGFDESTGKHYSRATGEFYDQEVLSYCFGKTPIYSKVNALNTDNTIRQIADTISLNANDFTSKTISVISPFFFLNKTISDALKSVNFFVDYNILNVSEIFRMLCIYNNFDITTNTYTVTEDLSYQEIVLIPDVSVGLDGGHDYNKQPGVVVISDGSAPSDEINIVSIGKIVSAYIRAYPASIKAKDYLPKMKLGELLLSTQNTLNTCFHFLPNSTVNIYSREAIITGTATDLDRYFLGTWDIGEKKCVALNFTHENDTKDLVFEERFTDITDRRADIKTAVANWEALLAVTAPVEGDIRWVTAANSYFEYRMITQTIVDQTTLDETTVDVLGWAEFSIGLQNGWYQYGRKEVEEIKTSWGTCFGDATNTLVNQQGNMNSWKAKLQPFAPRLLVYAGNNHGGPETDTFSLDYEKAGKGILPTCWKNWNAFWANRLEVTGTFDFPVNTLRHLIYNICDKYRTREGEFMIDEMSCDIYEDRIGETEIKGFKVE